MVYVPEPIRAIYRYLSLIETQSVMTLIMNLRVKMLLLLLLKMERGYESVRSMLICACCDADTVEVPKME